MSMSPRISIVIPVSNEEQNIEPLVRELALTFRHHIRQPYEILIVNDGSTDSTANVLHGLQVKFTEVRIIEHHRQYGQSAALVTGVNHARGSWIVTLDGDGQNDPADIPVLWDTTQRQPSDAAVLVTGKRVVRQDTWRKRWLSWTLNRFSAVMLRHEITDKGCGLKIFRRDDFLQLPSFDHMHRFLPGLFNLLNGRTISIPVNHRPRLYGRSHYGNAKRALEAVIDVAGIIWLKHRYLRVESREMVAIAASAFSCSEQE